MRASASAVSERHELEPAAAEAADHLRKRSPGSSSVWKCPQRSCRLTTAHSCARRTTWRAIRAGGDAVSQPPPGLTIGSGLTELRRVRVCLPAERAPRGREYRGNAPAAPAIACAPAHLRGRRPEGSEMAVSECMVSDIALDSAAASRARDKPSLGARPRRTPRAYSARRASRQCAAYAPDRGGRRTSATPSAGAARRRPRVG